MLHTEPLTSQAKAYPGLNYSEIEGTVLATIINRKVEDVKEIRVTGKRTLPRVSFKDALSADGRNFILECKQSSPTLGDFCRDFDLDKLDEDRLSWGLFRDRRPSLYQKIVD